jgi:hypothetical protein
MKSTANRSTIAATKRMKYLGVLTNFNEDIKNAKARIIILADEWKCEGFKK